jgi:hypothetical protein
MEQFAIKTPSKGNFKTTILVKLPINHSYANHISSMPNDELIFMARLSKDCIQNIKTDSWYQFLVVGANTRDVAIIMQEHKIELALCKARGITHMI